MSESAIERKHREIAIAAGWYVEKVVSVGRGGFPDRFYAKAGRVVLIEWKSPGEKPRPQQLLRHKQLRAAGVEVYVIDNIADANVVLHISNGEGGAADTSSASVSLQGRLDLPGVEDC